MKTSATDDSNGSPAHVQRPDIGARRLADAGIRPLIRETTAGGCRSPAPGFVSPFGRRHSLLEHPVPVTEFGLPHGWLTPPNRGGDLAGFPRSARVRRDRIGCPLYSGTAVLTQPARALRLPPAASQRPVLNPGTASHLRGCPMTKHARIHLHSPARSSPRLWSLNGAGTLGLFPQASDPAVTSDAR